MDLQMTGKKALVTGASEGIGKAITTPSPRRASTSPSAHAAGTARSDRRGNLTRHQPPDVPIAADLTKPADAENFVKKAHEALGRIDILVNNAGSSPGGVLEHLTEEDWANRCS